MRKITTAIIAASAAFAFANVANAQVVVNSTPGTDPYSGPTPTYNFDTPATTPPSDCLNCIVIGSSDDAAQPYGSTGSYFSVGPSTTEPVLIDLTAFGAIASLSFIWGSVDLYNELTLLGPGGTIIEVITGTEISALANGDRTNPANNPLVTLFLSGSAQNLEYLQLFSNGSNAFEIDNLAINAVPEPASWAMLLLGFGAIGSQIRRRRTRMQRQLA